MLSATLSGQPVECAPGTETARFHAPPGQTCAEYAGAFADAAGGYLLDTGAGDACEYCPYRSGDQYLQTLNIRADEKWRGEWFYFLNSFTTPNSLSVCLSLGGALTHCFVHL